MIFIQDKDSVKTFHTSKEVEEAIETLLKSDDSLVYSETVKGCKVNIVREDEA